jgi:hypothetical protein
MEIAIHLPDDLARVLPWNARRRRYFPRLLLRADAQAATVPLHQCMSIILVAKSDTAGEV